MTHTGSCSLIIKGNGLDFGEINERLKIEPSSVSRKGEIISKSMGENPNDVWIYEMKLKEDEEPNKVLEKLVKVLKPSASFIKTISSTGDVCLRCYIQSDYAQIFFDFSPNVIQDLAQLNIRLEVSILSWGGVEDE